MRRRNLRLFLAALIALAAGDALATRDGSGPIDNKSASAPDDNTPYGRYRHQIKLIVESQWKSDLKGSMVYYSTGRAEISVKIAINGKLIEAKALPGSTDELAAYSVSEIRRCTFPPIPDNLAPVLKDGCIQLKFAFAMLAKPQ
jgi:hypothetical protein